MACTSIGLKRKNWKEREKGKEDSDYEVMWLSETSPFANIMPFLSFLFITVTVLLLSQTEKQKEQEKNGIPQKKW